MEYSNAVSFVIMVEDSTNASTEYFSMLFLFLLLHIIYLICCMLLHTQYPWQLQSFGKSFELNVRDKGEYSNIKYLIWNFGTF